MLRQAACLSLQMSHGRPPLLSVAAQAVLGGAEALRHPGTARLPAGAESGMSCVQRRAQDAGCRPRTEPGLSGPERRDPSSRALRRSQQDAQPGRLLGRKAGSVLGWSVCRAHRLRAPSMSGGQGRLRQAPGGPHSQHYLAPPWGLTAAPGGEPGLAQNSALIPGGKHTLVFINQVHKKLPPLYYSEFASNIIHKSFV